MNRQERGFTLIELMITVAVLAVFSSVALTIGVQAKQDQQLVGGYQNDLRSCRAALCDLEGLLRQARRVEHIDDAIVLFVGSTWTTLRSNAGKLIAKHKGHERVLARCVDDIQITSEGALAHITLTLRQRNNRAATKPARLTTSVAMRNWEDKR